MKIVSFVVSLLPPVLIGCTSLLQSSETVSTNVDLLKEMNEDLQNRSCTIITRSGDEIAATDPHIGQDSTSYRGLSAAAPRSIANKIIERIYYQDHSRGGVDGLTIGAGVGLTIFVGGLLTTSRDDYSGFVFLYGGAAAVPIGWIVGSMIGHETHFVFSADSLSVK